MKRLLAVLILVAQALFLMECFQNCSSGFRMLASTGASGPIAIQRSPFPVASLASTYQIGIVERDKDTGYLGLFTLNGAQLTSSAQMTDNTGAAVMWSSNNQIFAGDFYGDGALDLLQWDTTTGLFTLWKTDGSKLVSSAAVTDSQGQPIKAGTNNQLYVGDFDGDGMADILLWDTSTGRFYIWKMIGYHMVASIPVTDSSGAPAVWGTNNQALVADFDGDGFADLLQWDNDTGKIYLWKFTNLQLTSFTPVTDTQGNPVTWGKNNQMFAGDFDGDGFADLLQWDSDTGYMTVWYMHGDQMVASAKVADAGGTPGQIGTNVQLTVPSMDLPMLTEGSTSLAGSDYYVQPTSTSTFGGTFMDPTKTLPSLGAVKPPGYAVEADSPATLDLADRATLYLQGISNMMFPEHGLALPGLITYNVDSPYNSGQATLIYYGSGGSQNWGGHAQDMALARRMSGYDTAAMAGTDDVTGNLSAQLAFTRNMLDPNVGLTLQIKNEGGGSSLLPQPLTGQNTTYRGYALATHALTLEALTEIYKDKPSLGLQFAIQQYTLTHLHDVSTGALDNSGTKYTYTLHSDLNFSDPAYQSEIGSQLLNGVAGGSGINMSVYDAGYTSRALVHEFNVIGDPAVLNVATALNDYALGFANSLYWNPAQLFNEFVIPEVNYFASTYGLAEPDLSNPIAAGSEIAGGTGHFAGHDHSYMSSLMGILWEAETRMAADPNDARAAGLIQFVTAAYTWRRDHYGQGVLGNFGETCAIGDMTRLALKLASLGAGDFYEDADRWIRNHLTEMQITPDKNLPQTAVTVSATLVKDASGNWNPVTDTPRLLSNFNTAMQGLFMSDATHALSVPNTLPAGTGKGTALAPPVGSATSVACCQETAIKGIYDTWDHIVDFKNNYAKVNLALNRVTPYLTIASHLPYGGRLVITMSSDPGPVQVLFVRLPQWADPSATTLSIRAPGATNWSTPSGGGATWQLVTMGGGNYMQISNVQPNAAYYVEYPIVMQNLTITQLDNASRQWFEGDYISPFQQYHIQTFPAIFRGNTFVDLADPSQWPAYSGIQLYHSPDRLALKGLPPSNVNAPETVRKRFCPLRR